MTKEELKVIITAYLDGKTIQYQQPSGIWTDKHEDDLKVQFHRTVTYRIKPERPAYRIALMKDPYDIDLNPVAVFQKTAQERQKYGQRLESSRSFVRWITNWIEYDPN